LLSIGLDVKNFYGFPDVYITNIEHNTLLSVITLVGATHTRLIDLPSDIA